MGSRRNLTQKQCVWHCTGCSTLRAMETRLPGANSWSVKAPIQFDEVIVFSTIWADVRLFWFFIARGVLLLDHIFGLGGYMRVAPDIFIGWYICDFIRPAWQQVIWGGNLNLNIAR